MGLNLEVSGNMIQKKLQKGSDYNKYDLDGDGIVDDDELLAAEKLHEIEENERYKRFYA